jgi:molybdenum cofactor guanylyltransferase
MPRARPDSTPSSSVVGRARDPRIDGVLAWVDDDAPGEGPLAALATALDYAKRDVLLVACDMPLINADALRWLADHAIAREEGGVVVRTNERLEPLFARYAPSSLHHVDALLREGNRSLRALIERASITIVDAPEWIAERLVNVNTPDELEVVQGRWVKGDG